jgi:diketogulonate reductase-like aldo/keto reductase
MTGILEETFTLANGLKIPKLGLGTWMIGDDQVAQVVRDAVQVGYRHFDTAEVYANERGVGEGVRTCGVPRDQLFVTTKLAAEAKTYAGAKADIERALTTLGLDYIDLLIIHSPQPWSEFRRGEHFFEGNLEAWRALEAAYGAGTLRAIGVSNFEQADLDNILENAAVKPMVNQILAHVGATPFELVDYIQGHGILVEAYSPVAHGEILNNRALSALAQKYGVTIAQLCLRYCLQLGMLPLPKTMNPGHMRSNAALDFEISGADMETLNHAEPIQDYGAADAFPVFGVNVRARNGLSR